MLLFCVYLVFPDSYVVTLKVALCDPGAGVSVSLDSYDARAWVPGGEEATSDGERLSGIHSAGQLLHSPRCQEFSVRTEDDF